MTTLTWMMTGATRLPYSSAWIDVALTPAGTVTLRGDSDALITKGFAALLATGLEAGPDTALPHCLLIVHLHTTVPPPPCLLTPPTPRACLGVPFQLDSSRLSYLLSRP